MNLIINKSWDKMSIETKQQQRIDDDHQQDIKDEDDKNKNDNSICQTIWLGVPYRTKYESSLGYKTVYNCVIPYVTVLMITGPDVLDNLENNLTNL